MALPLISTKLQQPTLRPGLVLRPRLVQRLNEGCGGKLTLISASTGFGKTTLACAWLEGCGRPVAWFALDELDNDPLRFLMSLVRAIQTVQPGFGADLLEVLNTATPQDFDPVPPHFLETLIAEIATIPKSFILTLDDYHLITRPAIQAVLQFLLAHQPANSHLVLVSRSDPPWPLARLRASREMNEIRAADLRFTPQEAAEFLNRSMGLGLTSEQVTALESRTEGWIAGLQLAGLSLQGQANAQEIIDNLAGSHRFIADYLIEEVLEKQTPEVQEFLLKTAVLDQLNADLCDVVTGRSDSQAILRLLEQNNLFLIPLDQERQWYRYHHLFADLLRIKSRQAYPDLTAEFQRRASTWYSGQGRQLEALHYALEAGDFSLVEQLLSGNLLLFFNHEDLGAVMQKLAAIPAALIDGYPWLMIARASLQGNGQFEKSLQILEAVAAHLEKLPESPEKARLRGHLEASWASVYNSQGDVENTVRHAEQAETWLPPAEVDLRALNMALWGDILSKDGHDPNAMPILERAMDLAVQADNPHVVVWVAATLAMGHLGAGQMRAAHRACAQALSIADGYQQRTGREVLMVCCNYAILARIHTEWNEIDNAIQLARRGFALSERLGQIETEVFCCQFLGYALMFQDDPSEARQVYQRALELARAISPWAEQNVVSLMVDGLLDHEPLDEAAVQEYLRVFAKTKTEYPRTIKNRLLLKTGQPAAALDMVNTWLAGMGEDVARLAMRPHLFRALALQAIGDEAAALAALNRALTQAEPENRQMVFLREGRPMETLLRKAERKAICPEFTRQLLAAFAQRTRSLKNPATGELPDLLSERELEILLLLAKKMGVPEIAEKLVLSANTVRTHIKSLYRKLNAHSRHEAITQARELNLL